MSLWEKIHFALWSVKMFFLENYYFIRYRKLWEKAKKFQNKYAGKRCFVIGNGPSLTKDDLDLLEKNHEISFSSNRIYKLFEDTNWRPTYYSVCDKDLFLDNKGSIESLSTTIFFPLDFIPYLSEPENNYYFARYPFKFFSRFPKFSNNINGIFGEGNTITYHLIQLAASMGFSEIYLLGCDFSYDIAIGTDGKIIKNNDQKNYPWKEDKQQPYVMPNLQANLYAYMSAKRYGDENGIRIFNSTRGGKLEIYPRISLESVLNKK